MLYFAPFVRFRHSSRNLRYRHSLKKLEQVRLFKILLIEQFWTLRGLALWGLRSFSGLIEELSVNFPIMDSLGLSSSGLSSSGFSSSRFSSSGLSSSTGLIDQLRVNSPITEMGSSVAPNLTCNVEKN